MAGSPTNPEKEPTLPAEALAARDTAVYEALVREARRGAATGKQETWT